RLRTRDHSFLRHVADQKNGYRQVLREQQELSRNLADLRDRSWRALQLLGEDGLNRINDDRLRLQFLDLVADAFSIVHGERVEPALVDSPPCHAKFDLALSCFARNLKHAAVKPAELVGDRA